MFVVLFCLTEKLSSPVIGKNNCPDDNTNNRSKKLLPFVKTAKNPRDPDQNEKNSECNHVQSPFKGIPSSSQPSSSFSFVFMLLKSFQT